jgi:hypothetical protein
MMDGAPFFSRGKGREGCRMSLCAVQRGVMSLSGSSSRAAGPLNHSQPAGRSLRSSTLPKFSLVQAYPSRSGVGMCSKRKPEVEATLGGAARSCPSSAETSLIPCMVPKRVGTWKESKKKLPLRRQNSAPPPPTTSSPSPASQPSSHRIKLDFIALL